MCNNSYFKAEQLKDDLETELYNSVDRLLTWIFDETVLYQQDEKIIKKIVSISDQLPLNI